MSRNFYFNIIIIFAIKDRFLVQKVNDEIQIYHGRKIHLFMTSRRWERGMHLVSMLKQCDAVCIF